MPLPFRLQVTNPAVECTFTLNQSARDFATLRSSRLTPEVSVGTVDMMEDSL